MHDAGDCHSEPPFSDAASYDALADLFLSDGPPGTHYGAEIPTEPVDAPATQQENGQRSTPKPTEDGEGGENKVSEPDDATVARGGADEKSRTGRNGRPRGEGIADVELLVAGHLPVLGGPWLAQYADRLAEAQGPVALVQLREGTLSVELLHPSTDAEQAERLRSAVAADNAEDALLAAAARAERWLLRFDDASIAELLESRDVARLTVVSAVDETSVVACYRRVKELTAALSARDAAQPTWRFVAAGTEPGAAIPGYARLATSAKRFLAVDIEQGPVVDRMRPLVAEQLGRCPVSAAPADVLTLIEAARQMQSESAQREQASGAEETAAAPRVELTADELSFLDELSLAHESEPGTPDAPDTSSGELVTEPALGASRQEQAPASPSAAGHSGEPPEPAEPQRWTRPPHESPPSAHPEASPAAAPVEVESICLAAEIGLTPLTARCPRAGSVELAVDDSGRVHALAQQGPDAVAHMLCAAAWAREHSEILSLSQPGVKIDGAASPVLHLFTDEAPPVRPLLDTDVRLHLLLRPSYERRQGGFVCADLN
jgi:hypothetical protein